MSNVELIHQIDEHHDLKSAFATFIQSSRDQTSAPLESSGYYYQNGQTIMNARDGSFMQRVKLFGKDYNQSTKIWKFRENSITFCGHIYNDLQSTDLGVPPGISVDLILHRNDPSKAIDSLSTGQVSHQFKITRYVLAVVTGNLVFLVLISFQSITAYSSLYND